MLLTLPQGDGWTPNCSKISREDLPRMALFFLVFDRLKIPDAAVIFHNIQNLPHHARWAGQGFGIVQPIDGFVLHDNDFFLARFGFRHRHTIGHKDNCQRREYDGVRFCHTQG